MIKKYESKRLHSNSFLVISGAMQTRYDQFHPLIQLLIENYGTVYSLGLPGHGEENDFIEKNSDHSLQSGLEFIYSYIDKNCPREKMVLIAYSIGSLLAIKLIKRLIVRNQDLKLILIGSSLQIRHESSDLIRLFFNEKTYKKMGWEPIMIRQHGKNWMKTVELIDNWLLQKSGISPTSEEIQILLSMKDLIQWIIAENDQPFRPTDILIFGDFNVEIVAHDHFSYFLLNKAWPKVKSIIEKQLLEWSR